MFRQMGLGVLLAAVLLSSTAARADAQQTIGITLGAFVPTGEDGRTRDDVLVENRTFLTFDVAEFDGGTVGGEWLIPVGRHIEAGAGVAFYRRTVPSVYTRFTDSNRNEIAQDLRLRVVPTTFTVRLLPLGQSAGVQPYVGAGLGVYSWRYSETGDFVNFDLPGRPVFRGTFTANGHETGPVALGGIRFASDAMSVGGEVRYQRAEASLDRRFAGSRLDLGGWTYQATVGLRFGGR